MRKLVASVVILSLMGIAAMGQGSPLFDRADFILRVQSAFADLEGQLPPGDAFDYDEAAIFSGIVNGYEEHVVIVPITQASVSYYRAETLGNETSWADFDSISMCGFYMMAPTNCIHTLRPETPYLVRAISWNLSEVVDANGVVERMFVTWARRGDPTSAYYKFVGNVEWHFSTCWTTSTNQK